MTDIRLELEEGGGADIVIGPDEDIVLDEGLTTPLLVSLFSDARAQDDDELPTPSEDRRGWWPDNPDNRFGSRLWLLEGAKITQDLLNDARQWVEEALQWFLDQEIFESISVAVSKRTPYSISIDLIITRGTAPTWEQLWDATATDTRVTTIVADIKILHR
jgi:phage gp46-like protein